MRRRIAAWVDRYARVPLAGVDLGSAVAKLVELAWKGDRLVVRRCVITRVDGAGNGASVRRALARPGGGELRAAIGLASPELVVKPLALPPMPPKERRGALRLEAEQAILNGHAMKDTAMDWVPLAPAATGMPERGVLAVAPKALVQERVAAARAAGVFPAVVDVEGLALWNAYWALRGGRVAPDSATAVINVGVRSTNLVIARGPDELLLVRDLRLGASTLTADGDAEWAEELRDSIRYARSHGGVLALTTVAMTGGGASAALIPAVQAAAPEAAVTVWNPLDDLRGDPDCPLDHATGPLLAVAVGLALRTST